jgi:hypothetical protein
MPQAPDATFAPDVDIDDSKKYILKLIGIEEQPSKFRDKNPKAMMLVHKWLVYDAETGVAIEDNKFGEIFELWQFTNDSTYDNPTSGKIAPAREIANALMGHRLSDDEVREMIADGWEESLMNRTVQADLEWYADAGGTQKLRVLRVRPYTKPAARQSRRRVEDDDEEAER